MRTDDSDTDAAGNTDGWMAAVAAVPADAVQPAFGVAVDHDRDWSADSVGIDIDAAVRFVDDAIVAPMSARVPARQALSVNALNRKQREAYDRVANHVADPRTDKSPLRLMVLGFAGTGKSYLIDCIRDLIGEPAITVSAPTGVAAFNINGSTVHSALAISVGAFKPLGGQALTGMQQRFATVSLFGCCHSLIPMYNMAGFSETPGTPSPGNIIEISRN